MENYIATVKLVGSTDIVELLNFGESPEEIVDNLVLMDNVEFLYHIKREKDNEPLRKIRKILDDADSSNINLEILLEEVDAIVEDKNKLN